MLDLRCARSLGLSLAFLLGFVAGCGKSGPQMVPVNGNVTLDGSPVNGASVMFLPDKGRPAQGNTDAQGHFSLNSIPGGAGAELGKYQVTVTLTKHTGVTAGADGLESGPASGPVKVEYLVPQKYSDPKTSGITIEVKPGMEPVKLELTSK